MGGERKEWDVNGRDGGGWGGGQLEVSLTDVSAAYTKKYIWIKT